MNEHAEHSAALTDIPMLTEYEEELSAPLSSYRPRRRTIRGL